MSGPSVAPMMWSARVDFEYFQVALTWLKKRPHVQYFFAHEYATREHAQGWVIATQVEKEKLSKAIVTKDKNGKGFSRSRNDDSLRRYCCKGTGINEPPADVYTNVEIDHKKLNLEYWSMKEKPGANITIYDWKGPSQPSRKRRTVYQKLLERCREEYDEVDIEGPQPKRRRVAQWGDIARLVTTYYGADDRLAGTGVKQRAFEGLLVKFGSEVYREEEEYSFLDNFRKKCGHRT